MPCHGVLESRSSDLQWHVETTLTLASSIIGQMHLEARTAAEYEKKGGSASHKADSWLGDTDCLSDLKLTLYSSQICCR